MSEAEERAKRDLYFMRAYWWIDVPMKNLRGEKLQIAIDRLNAIPSEMEVIKYLHDIGKIIYHDGDDDGYLTNWGDYKESIDIRFVEPERPDIALIYLAGMDAKNVGEDYQNVYLETQKQNESGQWELNGWAWHFYKDINGDPVRNRYLAFVRNGKEFNGKLATQTTAYDPNKTEKQNKVAIIKYYAEHQEELTHDIMIVYCDDVRARLDETGGDDLKKRTKDKIQKNAINTKALISPFDGDFYKWDAKHSRIMITWNTEKKTWNDTVQCNPLKPLEIKACPVYWSGPERNAEALEKTPDEQRQEKENELVKMQREQRGEITAEQFLKLEGIPDKFLNKKTILNEWERNWRGAIDDLFPLDYEKIIPDGELCIPDEGLVVYGY